MKTLFLLRHAKSSWEDASLADFERPLNDRGLKAAPFMGAFMQRNGFVPDLIISSPAERARHTAELVSEQAGFKTELLFDGRVYEASPRALAEVVSEVSDDVQSVMVVGHNPGMEGFVRYLTGQLEPMPTAAVAIIDLPLKSWSKLDAESGKLRQVFRPKELGRR